MKTVCNFSALTFAVVTLIMNTRGPHGDSALHSIDIKYICTINSAHNLSGIQWNLFTDAVSLLQIQPSCRSGQLLSWHINCLELRAIFLALDHFLLALMGCHAIVRTDKMTMLSHINCQGACGHAP